MGADEYGSECSECGRPIPIFSNGLCDECNDKENIPIRCARCNSWASPVIRQEIVEHGRNVLTNVVCSSCGSIYWSTETLTRERWLQVYGDV